MRFPWKAVRGSALLCLSAAGLVFAGLMLYHVTGARQPGYNRFSLDFMPVLLAMCWSLHKGLREIYREQF